MQRRPPDPREAAKRAALRALRKARALAERKGVALSEWEDGFLGDVSERVQTYGRAFADPEKGAPQASLSALQSRKLKEIVAKAKGEPAGRFAPRAKRVRPDPEGSERPSDPPQPPEPLKPRSRFRVKRP